MGALKRRRNPRTVKRHGRLHVTLRNALVKSVQRHPIPDEEGLATYRRDEIPKGGVVVLEARANPLGREKVLTLRTEE